MKSLLHTYRFYIIFALIIPIFSCGQCKDRNIDSGKVIKLSNDGSWGYAGRHAYIVNDKMFFSYLDQEGNTWVGSYDFETGKINHNKIWNCQGNLHSSNPFFIRPDGRIQVFLDKGAYASKRISWKVSLEPWSVSKFGELQESDLEADIAQGRQFYPMLHRPSGEVYLVINARRGDVLRETVMWKSSDGGDTWTNYNSLWGLGKGLKGNRCYTRPYMQGDNIHFVTLRVGWNEPLAGYDIGKVEGVYYTRYHIKNQSFFHADGSRSFTITEAPVYKTKYFDEIWNWKKDGNKKQRALWSDIVADENGKPYVAFAVQDAVPKGESALHDGYWSTPNEDGEWNFHKVATLSRGWDNKPERVNYAISINPENPEKVYVAESTSKDKNLSQIQCMETENGGKTWQSVKVLSEEGRLTTVIVPRVLDKSKRKIEALWLKGRMVGWSDFKTKIMAFLKKNDLK